MATSAEVPSVVMAHRPTFITYKNLRFLIMDAPTDQNLPAYIQVLQRVVASQTVHTLVASGVPEAQGQHDCACL